MQGKEQTKKNIKKMNQKDLSNAITHAGNLMQPIFISRRRRSSANNALHTFGCKKVIIGTATHKFLFIAPILARAIFRKV